MLRPLAACWEAFGAACNWLGVHVLRPLCLALGTAAGAVFNAIGTAAGAVFNAIGTAAGAVFNALGTAAGAVFNALGTAVEAVFDALGAALSWIGTHVLAPLRPEPDGPNLATTTLT